MDSSATPRRSLMQQIYQASLESVNISQEGEADGEARKEIEYVFFGQLVDADELKKASSVEHQEQWQITVPPNDAQKYAGMVRVRKSWSEDNDPTYVLCSKTYVKEGLGQDEVEIEVSEDFFNQIKRLAVSGMKKTRYVFDVEHNGDALKWEVDVYANTSWVKLDLEVLGKLRKLPEYPVQLTDVFDVQPDKRTDEEQKYVRKLLDEHMVSPNAFPIKTTE